MPEKPRCFVIIQIGKEGSETRLKSDRVLKYIVANALADKYDVQRADDIRQPGTVTVQIIEQLLEAPLVVADLSDWNANVYYELAIRHAVKKPVVHLITKGQEAPFDVNQMRYVSYDITAPESIEAAKQEVRENVLAIERGAELLTPIQYTQFVLDVNSGRTVDRNAVDQNASMLVNAVAAAITNISEELKSIKELVARTSPPMQVSPFINANYDPNHGLPRGVLSDMGLQQDAPSFYIKALEDLGLRNDEPPKK
jgi:hypothetical protein